ncbi:hypothetical protein L3Q82_016701, partial [Scortum barcoo]
MDTQHIVIRYWSFSYLLSVKSRIVKRSTCAGRWSEFNDRCFQYIPRPMTWAKAE